MTNNIQQYLSAHKANFDYLEQNDPILCELLSKEHNRQQNTLNLTAYSAVAFPSVLAASGSNITNLGTEGAIGSRFLGGCEYGDAIEALAIERGKQIFNAEYVNVQLHSTTEANFALFFGFLNPGDTILGLELTAGGHLTHGSKISVSGKYFNAIAYGLDENGLIDYKQLLNLAKEHKPKLIIAGASAYTRLLDYKLFREIADEVGAFLLADISHISGLIAAATIPSPIDYAHFVTTSTYKQLGGPRSGLLLMGKDANLDYNGHKLSTVVEKAIFPGFITSVELSHVAAKAAMFLENAKPEFKQRMQRVVNNSSIMADYLVKNGYHLSTNGSENHTIIIDILKSKNLTGYVAEQALYQCAILTNKNLLFADTKSAMIGSGLRLGTNTISALGIEGEITLELIKLVDIVLSNVHAINDREYNLSPVIINNVRDKMKTLLQNTQIKIS